MRVLNPKGRGLGEKCMSSGQPAVSTTPGELMVPKYRMAAGLFPPDFLDHT